MWYEGNLNCCKPACNYFLESIFHCKNCQPSPTPGPTPKPSATTMTKPPTPPRPHHRLSKRRHIIRQNILPRRPKSRPQDSSTDAKALGYYNDQATYPTTDAPSYTTGTLSILYRFITLLISEYSPESSTPGSARGHSDICSRLTHAVLVFSPYHMPYLIVLL